MKIIYVYTYYNIIKHANIQNVKYIKFYKYV